MPTSECNDLDGHELTTAFVRFAICGECAALAARCLDAHARIGEVAFRVLSKKAQEVTGHP
jgi:hypothetical protein